MGQHNFNKARGTTNFGMKYDYCSLMHYGATAFGGGRFTMVTKDLDYLGTIGRSHVSGAGLTYTDATIVNNVRVLQCRGADILPQGPLHRQMVFQNLQLPPRARLSEANFIKTTTTRMISIVLQKCCFCSLMAQIS